MKLPTSLFWEELASFIYRSIIQPALLLGLLLAILYMCESVGEFLTTLTH